MKPRRPRPKPTPGHTNPCTRCGAAVDACHVDPVFLCPKCIAELAVIGAAFEAGMVVNGGTTFYASASGPTFRKALQAVVRRGRA